MLNQSPKKPGLEEGGDSTSLLFPHLEKHAAPSEDTKSGKALLTQETGQMGRGNWWAVTGVGAWWGG